MRSPLALLLIGLLATPAGCGYRFVGGAAGAGGFAPRVSIETLDNDSLEPGIELMVSEALRRRFLRAGGIGLVEQAARADYAISGRVVSVTTASRSFNSSARAVEFTVTLQIRLELRAGPDAPPAPGPLWLAESEIYLASSDVEVGRKNREEALRRLAGLLASRVYDEVELLAGAGRAAAPGARGRGAG